MSTIPATSIVRVTPSVLAAGGRALDLIGLLLTSGTRVPIGAIQPFSNQLDVANYFGDTSTEAALAEVYFQAFDNSNIKPARILFAQYPTASVAAYMRGGPVDSLTLTQLQALPIGSITLTVHGSGWTAASVNLGSATSFSNAAGIIQTAFGTGAASVFAWTYDSIAGAFLCTTLATGSAATITTCSGTLASSLFLTSATGAIASQGAAAADPTSFMNDVVQVTQNWATFMLCFDPDAGSGNTKKLEFAQWNATQNNRWGFVCWDTDVTPKTIVPAPASLGQLIADADISGTCLISAPDATKAAFVCGTAAAIDFTEHEGRITFAFKKQSGLTADVTDQTTADNLEANHYNFYGVYATANDQFLFLYPGSVSGDFLWFDSYVDQIWLNNGLQLQLMVLLTNRKSIPYNQAGYSLIEAACLDQILRAVDVGVIRAGITLSQAQIAEVNNDAGLKIDKTLNDRGWYMQVRDAPPEVRAARGSPPCTLWYMDGQSIQRINLASIELV